MAKAKTSTGQKKSSRRIKSKPFDIHSIQPIQFKPEFLATLVDFDSAEELSDPVLVGQVLLECLMEGDHEAFKEILHGHLMSVNKGVFSKKTGIARSTLFRMLSPNSNPTLKNVAKLCRGLSKTFKKAG
jgi:DNA-binding phage protein